MDREWETEPNELDFNDDATGLPCRMRRGPGGHWCGYVALPAGHPLYGKGYRDLVSVPAGYMDREVKVDEDYGAISLFLGGMDAKPDENIWPLELAVRCHGGLTYAAERNSEWWLGFDCAHSGDYAPEYSCRYGGHETDVYRNVEYVKASLAKLCGDIQAISYPQQAAA